MKAWSTGQRSSACGSHSQIEYDLLVYDVMTPPWKRLRTLFENRYGKAGPDLVMDSGVISKKNPHPVLLSALDDEASIVPTPATCRRAARSTGTRLPHSSRLAEVPQALPVFESTSFSARLSNVSSATGDYVFQPPGSRPPVALAVWPRCYPSRHTLPSSGS
jgi:hypothetical protein